MEIFGGNGWSFVEIGGITPIKWPEFSPFLSEDWRRACSLPRHPCFLSPGIENTIPEQKEKYQIYRFVVLIV